LISQIRTREWFYSDPNTDWTKLELENGMKARREFEKILETQAMLTASEAHWTRDFMASANFLAFSIEQAKPFPQLK